MQEVEEPLLKGNFDYETISGQTGPLVYPAGFVYVFGGLRSLTDSGTNIFRAQIIFAGLHTLLIGLVLWGVYKSTATTPWYAIPLVVLSRRAHSIFELRLFNDGVAMLFAYAALLSATRNRWTLCCILFSLGVGIKMNVLLMAPGLALLLVEAKGLAGAVGRIALCGVIQVALAWPFLLENTQGYLKRSFDLGRVFLHKWTVNYKFLDEATLQSPVFAGITLLATLVTWLAFGHFKWSRDSGGLINLVMQAGMFRDTQLPAQHVVTVLTQSNLIGITCARSLHYQFYVWYVHSIPYLAFNGALGKRWPVLGLVLVLAIEVCFNVYPATPASSCLLQICNIALVIACWNSPKPKQD